MRKKVNNGGMAEIDGLILKICVNYSQLRAYMAEFYRKTFLAFGGLMTHYSGMHACSHLKTSAYIFCQTFGIGAVRWQLQTV